jgi:hypothetical protein
MIQIYGKFWYYSSRVHVRISVICYKAVLRYEVFHGSDYEE